MAFQNKEQRRQGTVLTTDPKSVRTWLVFDPARSNNLDSAVTYFKLSVVPGYDVVDGVTRFLRGIAYAEEAKGAWKFTATYEKNPNIIKLNLDFTGGTKKMLTSLETVAAYDCTAPVDVLGTDEDWFNIPDFGRSINVNGDKVDGVDIEDGQFNLTIDKHIELVSITGEPAGLPTNYLSTLYYMTPSVNDADFSLYWKGQVITFNRGELKFKGATINDTSSELAVDIKFNLSASRNISEADEITIGDSNAIVKKGWEYLWVYFTEQFDDGAQITVKRPVAAYVERVYEYRSFEDLRL